MKPAQFTYLAARSPDEALDALADSGTAILAGGQSLVLEMNYRSARPARLVDINQVADFTGATVADGQLLVRPLVRHRHFEQPVAPGPLGRLLARVAHHIANPPIRARGTMLGSLAYAHPAAEWPAVATTLDAELDLRATGGTRTVPAEQFFTSPPERTVRRPDELLIEARLPLLPEHAGVGFVEHRRTQASFAQLAAVAAIAVHNGAVDWVRIGLVNAADRPIRARAAEAALLGQPVTAVTQAAQLAGQRDAEPRPQPHADLAYQRHVVTILVHRALVQALDDAAANGD